VLDELTRTLIDLRLEKARECLRDAESMIALDSFASSANRSYYCIYHSIHAVLLTIGFSSSKHTGIIAEFRRVFVKTGVFSDMYSDIIGDAFKVRTKSDYDIHYVVSRSEVTTQLKNAKTFFNAAEAYIKTLLPEAEIGTDENP